MVSRALVGLSLVAACVLSACGGGQEPLPDTPYSPNAKYGPDKLQSVTLHEPEGPSRGLAVWIHGGGWVWGDKDDDVPVFADVVAQGIAVLNMNYRLGPTGAFPKSVDDVKQVLAAAQGGLCAECDNPQLWSRVRSHAAHGGIMVAGASAGGYLSVYGAPEAIRANPAGPIKCIVGQVPPVDFRPLEAYSKYVLDTFLSVYADGDLSPAKLATMSPAYQLEQGAWSDAMSRKWYLLYSTRDDYIPFATTAGFSAGLRAAGADLKQLDIVSTELPGAHNLETRHVIEHLAASAKDCFGPN